MRRLPQQGVCWLLASCLLLTSGCEMLGLGGSSSSSTAKKTPAKKTPAKKPKKKPKAKSAAEKVQEMAQYTRPEYPENVRRNPFAPDPDVVKPAGPNNQEPERPLEPLELFSVGQLSLAAIISEVAVPKAMFIDPQGFGHVVKEGDRIGRQGGKIVDIRDNEVDVRESGSDEEGTPSRIRTIRLREVELRSSSEDDLSEAERDALERLVKTKEGREALRRNFQDLAPGASAVGTNPRDARFRGIEPPQ